MQINKLELKNIKYYATLSEETPCYEATVYVNDKKAIRVSNRGCGACDSQDVYPQFMDEWDGENVLRTLNEYCVKTYGTEKHEWGEIDIDLECWCQNEMYLAQDKKLLTRNMKKNVMFFETKSDISKGKYYMIKIQNNIRGLIAYIRDKYPQSIILNELPFDEAIKVYRNKEV